MQMILFRHVITIDSSLKKEHDCQKLLFESTKSGSYYKRFDYLHDRKSKHYERCVLPILNTVCNANITMYLLSFEYWTENNSTNLSADIESQITKLISQEENRLKKLLSNISVSKNYFKTLS